MKAIDLFTGNGELVHKVRSTKDIIRHIQTREGNTSNYNILLGAGASYTSKIKTGSDLIDEWIVELYERYERKEPTSIEEARKTLELNHGSWYNPLNPYSSLFEKKYDLPSQRRRFVESEVDGKLPSIGYAFLTSLIENSFFHSAFTTNFDDLINEAFYQFSNIRPILCAHDSSVHSISISSKRPKIIKLHGDYLFDDIKSTLRETESLEQNIKEKFIEFCKEYGLVVLGYSGRDRSIMDVLEFLLKQDNYLNNGIYWCLRKDDEVCHTLRNLMWKDKVYPVLIDGFDEFLAEVHSKIIDQPLDLESNTNESKLKKTLKSFIADEYKLSKKQEIKNQIGLIKKDQSQHDIGGLINNMFDSDDKSDLSLTDFRNLLEVDNLVKKSKIIDAIEFCITCYNECNSVGVKPSYIKKIISLYHYNNDSSNTMLWCDRLITEDEFNLSYKLKKVEITKAYSEKFRLLKKYTTEFSKRHQVYNEIIMLSIEILNYGIDNIEVKNSDIETYIDKSKKLNPSLSNLIWQIEFDWIQYVKKQSNKKEDLEALESRVSSLIQSMSSISDESISTLNILTNDAYISEDFSKLKKVKAKIIEIYKHSSKEMKSQLLAMLNKIHHDSEKCKDIEAEDINNFKRNFYLDFINDKDIEDNCKILIDKAIFYINIEKNINIARTYFNNALECNDILIYHNEISNLADLLAYNFVEFLEKKVVDSKTTTSKKIILEVELDISIRKLEIQKSKRNIENILELTGNKISYITSLSYIYLLENEFEKVIELSQGISFTENSKYDVFSINLFYAAKKINHSIYNKSSIMNLSAKPKLVDIRICAFIILGQTQDAKRLIKEAISKNRLTYHDFKKWPIVPKELLEEIYNEVLQSDKEQTLRSA
jgi:hypothetical protein